MKSEKMQKHAYLIIANRNPGQLQTLLTLLDDSRNDIYLLVDRKSVGYPHDFQLNYATLFSVSPLVIDWGSYSQIEAEMRLFQAAAPGKYAYYHLLSGLDLPLANQDEIHAFFPLILARNSLPTVPRQAGHSYWPGCRNIISPITSGSQTWPCGFLEKSKRQSSGSFQ
ncbi:beta-1,6-N-acetylglucosaminyltransferase [Lactobacillus delbrueckii subsp. bulgaricus]